MPTLWTIPFSHYCERARWALDRAGIGYEERAFLPFLHMAPVALASSAATRRADTTSSPLSVPLLRLDDGTRLHDSAAILAWAATHAGWSDFAGDAAARELERTAAERIGPATRLFAYHGLLQDPALIDAVVRHNVGPAQLLAARASRPLFVAAMRKALRIDATRAAKARDRIERFADDVDARLADGRPWLGGDHFGSVDLSVAALSAPALVIRPDEGYGAWMPTLDALPPANAALARALRERPIGALILRAYQRERGRASKAAGTAADA